VPITQMAGLAAPGWSERFPVNVPSFTREPGAQNLPLSPRITPCRNRRLTGNRWEYP